MTLKPCLDCGELTPDSRCPDHDTRPPRASRAAGYDRAWDKLSIRARTIQDWCSRCGTTEDLTCDHTPEAWARKARGQVIRLIDVDVLCRTCNSQAGPARGSRARPNHEGGGKTAPQRAEEGAVRSQIGYTPSTQGPEGGAET